jgi:hypothetical protein
MSKYIYPFWATGKNGATPPPVKLPKIFRKQGSLSLKALKSIKINKKTGEYERR